MKKPAKRSVYAGFCVLQSNSEVINWWPGAESNCRHADFQSAALPTELPGQTLVFLLKNQELKLYKAF